MTKTRSNMEKEENNTNAIRWMKDKKAAEKEMAQTVTAMDKKREEEKKQQAVEKAEEEALAKAQCNEERRKKQEENSQKEATWKEDMPSKGINELLTALSDNARSDAGWDRIPVLNLHEEGDLPEKKKIKTPSTTNKTSTLKMGCYAKQTISAPDLPIVRPAHNHLHMRVILDAAMELNKDDPIASFVNGMVRLMNIAKWWMNISRFAH